VRVLYRRGVRVEQTNGYPGQRETKTPNRSVVCRMLYRTVLLFGGRLTFVMYLLWARDERAPPAD